MQATSVSYPYITVQAEEIFLNPATVADSNAQKIAQEICHDEDTITKVFALARYATATQPQFIRGGKNCGKNIVIMPEGDEKVVFFTTRDAARFSSADKDRPTRVFKSFLFRLDARGACIEVIKTVTLFSDFDKEKAKSPELHAQAERRISIMQDLERNIEGDLPQVPKNYAYIHYRGKHRTKLMIFQKQAYCDLQYYLDFNSDLHQKPHAKKMMLAIAKRIIEAVLFVHEKGYVHKDIKGENFLIDSPLEFTEDPQPVIKITDFDLTRKVTDTVGLLNRKGTSTWFSPEHSLNQEQPLTQNVDIWGVGLLLYQLSGDKHIAPSQQCLEKRADCYDDIYDLRAKLGRAYSETASKRLKEKLSESMSLNKEWLELLNRLPNPFGSYSLKELAERMIQKEPTARLPLQTALADINALIERQKLPEKA